MARVLADRQWPLVALVEVTPKDAENGIDVPLPPGAWVTNVFAHRLVAFNSGGGTPTATLTATDGTTVFINAQSLLGAAGQITAAVTTKYYPQGGSIKFTVAQDAASDPEDATDGLTMVEVEYVLRGKGREVQT